MLNATLKSLLARKLRLLLASFAVLLGISFVSGAFVLTDSLSKVFDNLFATVDAKTAVTVQGVSAFGNSSFQNSDREPVPQSVLDTVKKVDGVRAVTGDVGQEANLILPNGRLLESAGPPILGTSISIGSPLESAVLRQGVAPVGLNQMVVDAHTASKEHLKVGDTVSVLGKGPKHAATIVGIVGFGKTDSLAGAIILGFDPSSAQALFGTKGAWGDLSIASQPGVSDTVLKARVTAALPKGYEALTGQEKADQDSGDIKQGLTFFNILLQAFAAIALFVGMFLIFNTFSMLIAQRTRELALMRALGASRGQIMRSVLGESVVVGLVSSLGGFGIGVALALGFRSLLNAVGLEIPQGDTVVKLRTFLVCLIVGVTVTALAAVVPARRAARVAPVQAMRESGPAEERSLTRRASVGAGLLALGVLALIGGLSQGSVVPIGLGAVLSFLGVTVVSPVFARPVVGALALPFTRVGVSGVLGRGNAMRSPRRTSTTAAALMIGLALVSAISTLGASAKKSIADTVSSSLGADYILHTKQFTPFAPAAVTALRSKSELSTVEPFYSDNAEILKGSATAGKGGEVSVVGLDPQTLSAVVDVKVLTGDLKGLTDTQVAVSKKEAKSLGVSVGDTLSVRWAKTGAGTATVGAVYDDNQVLGDYVVTEKDFTSHVTDPQVLLVFAKSASSASPDQSRAAIQSALTAFPILKVQDQAQFVRTQTDTIDGLLNVITGLLILSVVIAILGIINTLALSVVERTRELGLLRAVGLQRRQLKRMIRVESLSIAIFGALLGIVVGLGFGFAFVSALHDQGITEFAIPTGRIVFVLLIAAFGGIVAAALPARRAARMNVLEAVSAA